MHRQRIESESVVDKTTLGHPCWSTELLVELMRHGKLR